MSNQPQTDQRERKRAQFADGAQPKSRTTPLLIVIVIMLVAIAAIAFIRSRSGQPSATVIPNNAASSDIRIPLADLSGQAKFYDYTLADNRKMRFFALKSSDGVYRVALDACTACYHAKKGYHQQGDNLICNNCGMPFRTAEINEVHGGCNPVSLPRAIEGDTMIIKASDLEARQQYF